MRGVGWVLATTVGLVVGGFVLHFPGSFGDLATSSVSAAIFGLVLGFINGVFVGLLQWLALRLSRAAGGALLLAMGIGIGVTHAVNDGGPNSIGLLGVSVLSGLGMALAFFGPLGERRPVALGTCFVAWVAALIIADIVTNAVGMPFSETPVGWSTHHAAEGLIVGLVWAVATAAIGLPAILRARHRSEDRIVEAGASA
jgi:hypothetical protein